MYHSSVLLACGILAFTSAVVLVVKIKGVILFKRTRKRWNAFIAFTMLNPTWFVLMLVACASGELDLCRFLEEALYISIASYVVLLLIGFYHVTRYSSVSYQKIQEALRVRSSFLHTVVHDLRTPLNGISGNSELLLEGLAGELSPELRAAINDIHASAAKLLTILDGMTAQIDTEGFFDLQTLSIDNDAVLFKRIISEMEGKLVEAGQAAFVTRLWGSVDKEIHARFFGVRNVYDTSDPGTRR